MPERMEVGRLEGRVDDQDKRLRSIEQWNATHDAKCDGRHLAIDVRFDGMEESFERTRKEVAAAHEEMRRTAAATALAAQEGRERILFWVRTAVGMAATIIALGGGSQTGTGQLALEFLKKL